MNPCETIQHSYKLTMQYTISNTKGITVSLEIDGSTF